MHPFPHHYQVSAKATADDDVVIHAAGLPELVSQPPLEFDGPGDRWSPESLLMASIADCFTLSFRAIAAASRVSFTQIDVDVKGSLNLVENKMMFTEVEIIANLQVPADVDPGKADRLLAKAENACLVTNSLNVECHLRTNVSVA